MKKPLFNRITIVGVGLIGGSIGMAVKKRRLAKLVVGVVRKPSTAKRALSKRAVDVAVLDIEEGVRGADLVILCGPVSVILKQLKTLSKFIDKNTLVIDVGSSKEEIGRAAARFLKRGKFVGCHPMAGSEKTGVQNGSADLFEGATCFVTSRVALVNRFWKSIGAAPVAIDAPAHDAWVARSSHLPHILSFCLFQDFPGGRTFSNPSIRDFARLSRSDAQMWADIVLSNKKKLIPALVSFQKSLADWIRAASRNDKSALFQFIRRANAGARHLS